MERPEKCAEKAASGRRRRPKGGEGGSVSPGKSLKEIKSRAQVRKSRFYGKIEAAPGLPGERSGSGRAPGG